MSVQKNINVSKSHLKPLLIGVISAAVCLSGCKGNTEAADSTAVGTERYSETEVLESEKEGKGMFDLEKEKISYYNNPLLSEAVAGEYNCGDPFVMRYDGRYYLYCSARGSGKIYCHVSDNLADWSEGVVCVPLENVPVITNEFGNYGIGAAYAPEVTYFNGKFYMVTSFGGMGHYVYVADNPMGPFEKASDNFGMTIDGDIFIDSDGSWYFYHADGQGIKRHEMTSPTQVSSSGTYTGSIIDDTVDGSATWSEGSMIVCHDGIYYMTYTGNHVMSNSYRIDYATNRTGAGDRFEPSADDPLLISADVNAEVHGIGHSSTVKGPDLDSYYIVYHAMSNSCGSRTLNVDRMYFNGEKLYVMGPTTAKNQICFMPDIYSFFDGDDDKAKFEGDFKIDNGRMITGRDATVLAKGSLSNGYYTVELTTAGLSGKGSAGVVFGYKDEKNYGSAMFNTGSETLEIAFTVNGESQTYSHSLVRSFDMPYDFAAVQSIQVERNGDTFTFYVNDRELCSHESALNGSRVGVRSEGIEGGFGYIGASGEVGGTSNKRYYKPVADYAGSFLAIHCTERNIVTGELKGTQEKYLAASDGDSYNYRINAAKKGGYDIAVSYRSSGATLAVYADGEYKFDLALSDSGNNIGTAVARGMVLTVGPHVVTVEVKGGGAELLNFELPLAKEVRETEYVFDGTPLKDVLAYRDGRGWKAVDGILTAQGPGRAVVGNRGWGDYIFEADITPTSDFIKLGLLLRVQEICNTGLLNGDMTTTLNIDTARASLNWLKGYYAEFTTAGASLKKCRFDISDIADGDFAMKNGESYHIKAVCDGGNIKVYVNDALVMDYTDSRPFIQGMAGFRIEKGSADISNVKIAPLS